MKYYEITNERDPKITGIKSGASPSRIIASIFKGQEWVDEFLYGKDAGYRRGNFPERDFKLDGLPLDKGAKLTDFISVGSMLSGFVVNEKVIKILETCKLPQHKYYEVKFKQEGSIIEGYYWFYYNLLNGSNHVNYEKSLFDTQEEEEFLGQKCEIKSYDDYINLTQIMNRAVHVLKIVFDKTFDPEIDLFGMCFFGSDNYISERLKQKFEDNKIVGYKLRYPLTDPEIYWE